MVGDWPPHEHPVQLISGFVIAKANCIVNMDQTPLHFEHPGGRTNALKGDKTVWAKAIKS